MPLLGLIARAWSAARTLKAWRCASAQCSLGQTGLDGSLLLAISGRPLTSFAMVSYGAPGHVNSAARALNACK